MSNVNRQNGMLPASGTFNTITATSVVSMGTVPMNGIERGSLACEIALDGETDTITLTPKWQVSRDGGSTWIDVAPTPANGSYTIQVTGTAGADATVTRVIPAPEAVYSYPLARVAVLVGVVTGAAIDTYVSSYSWNKPAFI